MSNKISKPSALVEKIIIEKIISKSREKGMSLPPERELAVMIGVTRPTLREALQRLAVQGWLTIKHGKPTIVNDYIADGTISMLGCLLKYNELLPNKIIEDWLIFRVLVLPGLAQIAVKRNKKAILEKLKQRPSKKSNSLQFAQYDFELQYLFVQLSGNTIAIMLYNDLKNLYIQYSRKYFRNVINKALSITYYENLEKLILKNRPKIGSMVKKVMKDSLKNYLKK